MRKINSAIDDQRRNMIQALKTYYQKLLNTRKAALFQDRLEKHIADKGEIKDHLGLPMSEDEMVLEAQSAYIQLRFMRSDLYDEKVNLMKTWNIGEKELERYWKDWFVDGKEMMPLSSMNDEAQK